MSSTLLENTRVSAVPAFSIQSGILLAIIRLPIRRCDPVDPLKTKSFHGITDLCRERLLQTECCRSNGGGLNHADILFAAHHIRSLARDAATKCTFSQGRQGQDHRSRVARSSGRPATLVVDLRLGECGEVAQRLLPAEIAGLQRDHGRQARLHDVDLGSDGDLFSVTVTWMRPGRPGSSKRSV